MKLFFPPVARCLAVALALSTLNAGAQVFWEGPNDATWNTDTSWSDGQAPSSGKNYFVNGPPSTALVIRTNTSTSTFGGGSLTLAGQLELRAGDNNTSTADNFTLSNGSVIINAQNSTQTIAGNFLNVADGTSYMRSSAAGVVDRNITISSLVTGGPNASVHFLRRGTLALSNGGNTFAGTWMVGGSAEMQDLGGMTTFTNASNAISTLSASAIGSLGVNSSVTLNLWSQFNLGYDWTTTGSLTLVDRGVNDSAVVMTLNNNITVGELFIAGASLGAGTYTYSELNTTYDNYFADGGSGGITVIPEPNVVALFALGSFGVVLLLARRRRLFSTR